MPNWFTYSSDSTDNNNYSWMSVSSGPTWSLDYDIDGLFNSRNQDSEPISGRCRTVRKDDKFIETNYSSPEDVQDRIDHPLFFVNPVRMENISYDKSLEQSNESPNSSNN